VRLQPILRVMYISEVTSTITIAIKGLQDTLQNTITSIFSQQCKESLNFIMQSQSIKELDADVSQEMDCQSHRTEKSGDVSCKTKLSLSSSSQRNNRRSAIRFQREERKE